MDTGRSRLPRLQVSHGVGWSLLPRTVRVQTGTASGSAHFRDSSLGSWLGPVGCADSRSEQDGGSGCLGQLTWPELLLLGKAQGPHLTSMEARTCSKNIQCLCLAGNTSRLRSGWPGPPASRPLSPQPTAPSPSSRSSGTPKLPPGLRLPERGAGRLAWERDHRALSGRRGPVGEGLRERWPQGQMSGRPSAAAANVSTLRGRALTGKEGDQAEWGGAVTCTAPHLGR